MQNKYSKLSPTAKYEVCAQFLKLYSESTIAKIHEVFKELNPIVEWNDDGEGEYNVWEVWKNKFEKLLATK